MGIPQASGRAPDTLVSLLADDHIADEFVSRHVHLLDSAFDNVCQSLRKKRAFPWFIRLVLQIGPQDALNHFLHVTRDEFLLGVRFRAISVLHCYCEQCRRRWFGPFALGLCGKVGEQETGFAE